MVLWLQEREARCRVWTERIAYACAFAAGGGRGVTRCRETDLSDVACEVCILNR